MDNKKKPYKKLGERINTLLANSESSQKELAEILDVLPNVVSYYCGGSRCPSISQLIIIADHFNTTVDYLLGRSDLKSTNADDKYIYQHTGLTDGSLITIQQAKNEQEAGGAPALDALNGLLSDDDFAGVVDDLANIKALQAAFEPTADDTTRIAFERDKFALEISVIRHFENLRRRMIEQLAGVDYER
ncbi:MAG: helix-turn-helix transcriptional regulator [Ruminococcus sp.]|nr:helix-turn-helix transcriptional regulator [Ruminococcus sp.]